jgi:dipeptidyl aminopeptidase/acylaminoacyl peptidase
MSRALTCNVPTLLALGLALSCLAPTRGDDGKDQVKKKSPASPVSGGTGTGAAREPRSAGSGSADPAVKADGSKGKARASSPESAASAPAKPAAAPGAKPVSFIHDVAPILVENCIACHNPKKSESKYVMTTFAQFAKGGQQGEGITLEPGEPDESNLVELIRPGGQPRMPYKQDPLPAEKIATIERWVAQGAKYDGISPTEDWTILLRKTQVVTVPASYPVTVPITALEFNRDGATVAASGYHEITFWKAKDGLLDRRLDGLAERVYDISYSPDGKWLATASGDPGIFGVAKLWLAEPGGGGKPVRDLVETQDVVFAVAFSPDSKRVATAGADRAIRVFEVETGKLLAQIEDHADWIFAIAFSPDGKRLASASRDKTCKVFDLEKKESLVTFPGHAQPVYTVSFAPDGKAVVTGGEDNRIRFWSPDNDGKQVRDIGGFGGTVFRLRFSPDGQTLAACSADKTVQVFKATGSPLRRLQGHQDWIYSLAISRDGKTLASGSWDGEVRLWNLADGKLLRNFFAAPGFKPATTQAAAR